MLPQQLLLSGVLDVRERYLRALSGLEEAEAASDPGTRTVLNGYRRLVLLRLADFQSTVAPLVEGLLAGFERDPTTWDQTDLRDLTRATIRGFDELYKVHLELCVYLPSFGRTREDLSYLMTRALGLSLMSREHSKLLSVQQAQTLTWEATRLAAPQASGPSAAAIAVPWLETLTPLRWPLAVHELGHYFLPAGELARTAIKDIATERGWRRGDDLAFKEIVADAVAQRAFGDAYTFALAREGYLFSYQRHVAGGVSVKSRLELLGTPNDLITQLPTAWNLGQRTRPTDDPEPETPTEQAQLMRADALNLVGEPAHNRPECVQAARDLIKVGEPAAAVTYVPARSQTAVEALSEHLRNRRNPPLDVGMVEGVASLAVQVSLTDGEILEAAWREDCDRDFDFMLAVLTKDTFTDGEVEAQSHEVNDRDTWLARSLQSAAVHRWLAEARELAEANQP